MNLAHALAGYWLENESRMSPATIAGYRWAFRRFTDHIGGQRDVSSITSDDIRRFLTHLRDDDLSGKSRYNVWVALSSFWSWAEREPALRLNHVIRGVIQQPKYTQKKIVPYTQAELMAMIEACEHSAGWTSRNGKLVHSLRDTGLRDRAIIILLVDTGLRASEICGLKIRDYNHESGAVDVLGKGGKERIVYAGINARKALWRYLATRPNAIADNPLFANRTGQRLQRDNLRHLVQRIAKRTGVKDVTLHRFRHTFAITFLRNGGNVLELKQLLGHEQMDTVSIYVDLAQSDLHQAQKRASPADNWRLR